MTEEQLKQAAAGQKIQELLTMLRAKGGAVGQKAKDVLHSVSTAPGRWVGQNVKSGIGEAGAGAKQELKNLSSQAQAELGNLSSKAQEEARAFSELGKQEGIRHLTSFAKQVAPGMAAGAATGALGGATHDDPRLGAGRGMLAGALGGLGGRALGPGYLKSIGGGAALGLGAGALFGKDKREQKPATKALKKAASPVLNKYAGVVLDWYDDKGETLKGKFPTPAVLPAIIKEARILPKEKLAHEDFALVAVDSGNVLRKFACHNPGTTAMSVIYFLEHGDKLPEGAQKLAASNLVDACRRFEITPPAILEKVALSTAKALALVPLGAGLIGAGVGGMAAGDKDRGKGMMFGAAAGLMGGAAGAVAGSAARAAPVLKKVLTGTPAAEAVTEKTVQQVAGGALLGTMIGSAIGGGTGGLTGRGLGDALRSFGNKEKKSMVDITGQRPAPKVKVARPLSNDDYAVVLPDGSRHYPISSWDLVKKAEVYYNEEGIRMQPEIRRQFATKLAAKAYTIGYPLDADIFEAGAVTYAASGHLKAAVEMRKTACAPGQAREFLDELFEKHASLEPSTYAECLRRFDVEQGLDRGWDRVILDPWASTFGIDKTAEVVWEHGADRVTDRSLKNLAENHTDKVTAEFTDDMAHEFKKDPVGIFKSMPDPMKKILARMANDSDSLGQSESGYEEQKAAL